jgi:hypothetical protein
VLRATSNESLSVNQPSPTWSRMLFIFVFSFLFFLPLCRAPVLIRTAYSILNCLHWNKLHLLKSTIFWYVTPCRQTEVQWWGSIVSQSSRSKNRYPLLWEHQNIKYFLFCCCSLKIRLKPWQPLLNGFHISPLFLTKSTFWSLWLSFLFELVNNLFCN